MASIATSVRSLWNWSAGGSRYSQVQSDRSQSEAFWVFKVSVTSSVCAVPLKHFIYDLEIDDPAQLHTIYAFSPLRNQVSHMEPEADLWKDTVYGAMSVLPLNSDQIMPFEKRTETIYLAKIKFFTEDSLSPLPFLCQWFDNQSFCYKTLSHAKMYNQSFLFPLHTDIYWYLLYAVSMNSVIARWREELTWTSSSLILHRLALSALIDEGRDLSKWMWGVSLLLCKSCRKSQCKLSLCHSQKLKHHKQSSNPPVKLAFCCCWSNFI